MDKKELEKYIWIQLNIDTLEEQLFELETRAENTTSVLNDMPKGSPGKDKIANIVCDIVRLQEKINNKVAEGYDKLNKIEDFVEELEERDKVIIRLRYIKGLKWEEIGDKIGYNYNYVKRLHNEIIGK